MSRENGEVPENADDAVARPGGSTQPNGLASRLGRLERAYAELLERVHRYERERVEIRNRLARILERLGSR